MDRNRFYMLLGASFFILVALIITAGLRWGDERTEPVLLDTPAVQSSD
ncbi:MAG: hypothetical protein ABWZ57_02265 [Mesorhizobium sp.]